MSSELAKTTDLQSLDQALSYEGRAIAKARQNIKMSELSADALDQYARTLIAENLFRIGQRNLTQEVISVAVADIKDAFTSTFSTWSAEEIRLACKMGALGELGVEDLAFSSRTLFKWLRVYEATTRRTALKEISQAATRSTRQEDQPRPSTQEEALTFVEVAFGRWRESGNVMAHAFVSAEAVGLIRITPEDKAIRMEEALKRLVHRRKMDGLESKMTRLVFTNFMRSLESLVPGDFSTYPTAVANEARRHALETYFQDLQNNELTPRKHYELTRKTPTK